MCEDFLEIPVALSASMSAETHGTPAAIPATHEYSALYQGLSVP